MKETGSKRILVTGGAGFPGSHLCDYLLEGRPEHSLHAGKGPRRNKLHFGGRSGRDVALPATASKNVQLKMCNLFLRGA